MFYKILKAQYFGANIPLYLLITFFILDFSNSCITLASVVSLIFLLVMRLYFHLCSTLSNGFFGKELAISIRVFLNVTIMAYIDSYTLFISIFPSLSNSTCVNPLKSTLFLIFSNKLSKLEEGLWLTTLNWLLSFDSVLSSSNLTQEIYFLLCFYLGSSSFVALLALFPLGF